ncbi:MAG TPA: sulfurtransferase TusA family protein [Ktedonobacteraceae bacterium]|nr:sulfurtransferase TusA family protein [Ktedonobacteraceae bacterium]
MTPHADYELDLGEQGCGQLVMELLFAMRKLAPAQTLLVTAYDPAAASDIAAWCRMTGNTLVQFFPIVQASNFFYRKDRPTDVE